MNFVCLECVGDGELRNQIRNKPDSIGCTYCTEKNPSITLERLAERVESVINRDYARTPDSGEHEYDERFGRGGSPIDELISDLIDPSSEGVTESIAEYLCDKNYDMDVAAMGDECEFAKTSQYVENFTFSFKWGSKWDNIVQTLQGESRFFNDKARKLFDEIFHDIETIITKQGGFVVDRFPAQTAIYRARAFEDNEGVLKVLASPDKELGAPPLHIAGENRMNAKGISVFYGASDVKTAIAEVRPSVGSTVVVGEFQFTQTLNLLDLRKVQDVHLTKSRFHENYKEEEKKLDFIKTLCFKIARPITPKHTSLEYITTQAFADYLASHEKMRIAGIVFPSSQNPSGHNTVLFNKYSKCEPLEKVDEATTTVNFYSNPEEENDEFYTISFNKDKSSSKYADYSEIQKNADVDGENKPTYHLKIDKNKIEVHQIKAVEFLKDTNPTYYNDAERAKGELGKPVTTQLSDNDVDVAVNEFNDVN